MSALPADLPDLTRRLDEAGYLVDDGLAMALFLSLRLGQPLLLEGEPGVGKTAAAKALATVLDTPLIRLQCYEGLTTSEALYEWNYQRQLLAIRLAESREEKLTDADLFTEEFLQERPILRALRHPGPGPAVLLIDEIDRADEAFEAFLLELLSDFQLSIPELGTIRARSRPWIVLTSNGTRELSEALRRRCLYHYVEYPSFEKELLIVETRIPQAPLRLARQLVEFVQALRQTDLQRRPGIAETLDWVAALLKLDIEALDSADPEALLDTLSALLKTRADRAVMTTDVVQRMVAAC